MTPRPEGHAPGVDLGAATWRELAGRRPVLLLPLGSTEQHGPHLPLDTDTRVAESVARAAADELTGGDHPLDVVVAPPVAYGSSGEHEGFAGTLSLGQDALAALVIGLVRSAGDRFGPAVLVNGHGGNVEAVGRAVEQLGAEGRVVRSWVPRPAGGDAHAGRTETSLLLALAPDVVHLDRAEAGATTPLPDLLPLLRAGGLAAVTANGVLGDPGGASVDEGRVLLEAMVADLVSTVRALVVREGGAVPTDGRDPR